MTNGWNSGWTETRSQQLSDLWCSDLTPEAIANVMGGFAHTKDGGRKAVIGRANRMGLPPKRVKAAPLSAEELAALHLSRRQRQAEREKARVRSRGKNGATPRPKPAPKPEAAPFLGSLNIAFGELLPLRVAESNQCRFIEGEGPEYLACANETLPGVSWCGHHHAIVYNKPIAISDAERERRSRNATKNWRATQVKLQGAHGEAAFA
jgi:hypothetical protein